MAAQGEISRATVMEFAHATKDYKSLPQHVAKAKKKPRKDSIRPNAKSAQQIHSHTRTDATGTYDIAQLIQHLQNRPVEQVPLEAVQGVNGSRRTGFSPKRLAQADTQHPVLLDQTNQLIDGRHRMLKLRSEGASAVSARRVSPEDLAAVKTSAQGSAMDKAAGVFWKDLPEPNPMVFDVYDDAVNDPESRALVTGTLRTQEPRALTRLFSNPQKDLRNAFHDVNKTMASDPKGPANVSNAQVGMMLQEALRKRYPSRYRVMNPEQPGLDLSPSRFADPSEAKMQHKKSAAKQAVLRYLAGVFDRVRTPGVKQAGMGSLAQLMVALRAGKDFLPAIKLAFADRTPAERVKIAKAIVVGAVKQAGPGMEAMQGMGDSLKPMVTDGLEHTLDGIHIPDQTGPNDALSAIAGGGLGAMVGGGLSGAIYGGVAGAGAGHERGHTAEGIARGLARGGMTGGSAALGAMGGAGLGAGIGAAASNNPAAIGAGGLIGGLLGAMGGGAAGWMGSGALLGEPTRNKAPKAA